MMVHEQPAVALDASVQRQNPMVISSFSCDLVGCLHPDGAISWLLLWELIRIQLRTYFLCPYYLVGGGCGRVRPYLAERGSNLPWQH